MKPVRLALALLFVPALHAQIPAAEPLISDVHPSPYRHTIDYRTTISPQRFDMRQITVLDMIEFAYDLGEQDDDRENAAILGGPSWIDLDCFDVTLLLPSRKALGPTAAPDAMSPMRLLLRRVLAERFHLKFHTEQRPLPGYVVTVADEGLKLSEARHPTSANECHGAPDKSTPDQFNITCTSETIAQFVATLDQDFPHPIADATGLTKPYDFTLKLALGPHVHMRDDRARVYSEAMLKQLGLKVAHGDVPQPAIAIDTVDRTPSPNPPEIAKRVAALEDLQFEVASIRLAADDDPPSKVRPTGSQIVFSSFTLQDLIVRAWQLPTGAMLAGTRPPLPRTRFTILGKLPAGVDGIALAQDQDLLNHMLQGLLIDRFQIKSHWGEWTQKDAYVLRAGTPRMKKADPNSRTFCKYGPPEGEPSARSSLRSPFDREFHCQNVTMAQFADFTQAVAGSDVKNRVPDQTGLTGSYDFTVFYTSANLLATRIAAAAEDAKRVGDTTAAPADGLSLEDAFRKQLGLKLEKQSVVLPALILDHYDAMPTEN